ncbi:hypothetical protein KO465_09105 [Candidatus Micrarchaeota archaeon]|jgi:hypothetical protein|nr:hypothetical protein [Candidatus Micrarchaeota archaeon]
MSLLSGIQDRIARYGQAQQQGNLGHIGSWGTKDFGVSEFLKNTLAPLSTPTYASSNFAPAYDSPIGPQPSGQVLRTTTPTRTYASSGQQAQQDTQDPSAPRPSVSVDDEMRQIDNIFSEVNNYLNSARSNLTSSQASVLQDLASQLADRQAQLTQSKTNVDRTLTEAEIGTQQRRQDADAASVRLFNELMQGGQQRFGGASSAGQAFTELGNVEQQRRAQATATDFNTAMRQIESERTRVEEEYSMGQQQLVAEKQRAENEIKRDFAAKMLEIDRMGAEAGQNKGAMKLDLLQQVRNQMYQVDLQDRQFHQQLEAMRQASLMELQNRQAQLASAGQSGQAAFGAFQDVTAQAPQSNLDITRGQAPTQPGMIGRIDDETNMPIGRVAYNQDPRLQSIFDVAYGGR